MAFVVLGGVRNTEHSNMLLLRDKLRVVRSHLGLTQDQLAGLLGLVAVSRRSRISEWESGKTEPNRMVLLKYSELSDIPIKQLIDDKEVLVLEHPKGK